MAKGRGFQEITVTRLGYQTQIQRFGPQSMPHTPPTDDSDSEEEEEDFDDNHNPVPRIVQLRMNLTVLSQIHNLYFAVYGDQIYVYRPQGSRQALPSKPSLIIDPPQTERSLRHSVNRYHEHIINHLVIGNLGNTEILLCSCHDGDIIAYYTQAIENALLSEVRDGGSIKPFFEENIGASAWGLCIHKQSRLIAAGSNNHEVQVFAFALSKPSKPTVTTYDGARASNSPLSLPARFPVCKLEELPRCENKKVSRDFNFRMVFKLEPSGDNVPSVAFSDDSNGDAQSIVAKDIRGFLWFFSLWTKKLLRLPSMTDEVFTRTAPLGWGVIILPRTFFKPTHNPIETWGSAGAPPRRDIGLDISKTIGDVRDSAVWYERHESEEDEENEDEFDDEDSVAHGEHIGLLALGPDHWNQLPEDDHDDLMYDSEILSPKFSPTSQSAQTAQSPTSISYSPSSTLGDEIATSLSHDPRNIPLFASSGPTIIHTNRHSIHLLPTIDSFLPTYCKNALRQEFSDDVWFPRVLSEYDRLNMLAAIPELSLVLVASQVGRVALFTVTRLVDRFTRVGHSVAMRLDLILPFKSEETQERIRPTHGLMGIAVAPMQGERKRGAKTGEGPRRWRLMLHYLNYTILSYEISRREEIGETILF